MESFYSLPTLKSDDDVLRFFKTAIEYRNSHKSEYGKIARFVFDSTHRLAVGIELNIDLERIRAEFIALEAPGMPLDDNLSPEVYDDRLWKRLESMVDAAIEKRTV